MPVDVCAFGIISITVADLSEIPMTILRRWKSRIRTADREAYTDYVARTGGGDYRSTPGNLGFQMLLRDLGDGTTEVTTLSWWTSIDAIKAFGHL